MREKNLPAVRDSSVATVRPRRNKLERLVLDRWVNTRNKFGGSSDPITLTTFLSEGRMTRATLDDLFEADWMTRKIVEIPPNDATRKWITLHHKTSPDKAENVRKEMERLDVRGAFREALTLSRLYGGCLLILGAFDGREVSAPLNVEGIKRVHFFSNIDRWLAFPVSWYTDPEDPQYGKPETYLLNRIALGGGTQQLLVHESRVVRFEGNYATPLKRLRNIGWGTPVPQNIFDALRQFGVSMQSGASVLQDYITKKLKISNLLDLIANDDWDSVHDRLAVAALYMSINNIAIYGEDEEFEKMGTPIQGLDKLMDKFISYLCSAAEIPRSRLFQAEPGALGGDPGKSDLRVHYDNVASYQENTMHAPLRRVIDVVSGALGYKPGEIDFDFAPLWELSETQKAELAKTVAETDQIYINTGVVTAEEVALSRFSGDQVNLEDMQIDLEAREKEMELQRLVLQHNLDNPEDYLNQGRDGDPNNPPEDEGLQGGDQGSQDADGT